jgi:hypothetical protein
MKYLILAVLLPITTYSLEDITIEKIRFQESRGKTGLVNGVLG